MCVKDYPIYACGKELFPGPAPSREYPCGKNCKSWEIGRYQSEQFCMSPRCDVCIQKIQPKTAKWTDPQYSRYYNSYGTVPPVSGGGGGGGGQIDPGYGDPSGYGGYGGGGYGGGDPAGYGGYGGGGGGQVDPGYGGGGYGGGDPSGYGGYGGGDPSGSGYGGGGSVPLNPMPRPNPNPFAGDNPPPLPSWLRDDEEKKGSKKSKGKSHRKHR